MQLTSASGDLGLNASEQMRQMKGLSKSEQVEKAAGQFEKIFLRQYLTEALKPMIKGCMGEGGPGADIYRSMMVDTLADGIQSGGGMGLSNVIQLQIQQPGANKLGKNAQDNE